MPQAQLDYAGLADQYDRTRRAEPVLAELLCEALRALNATTVLEIGAGTGNYTVEMAARGFDVAAVDRSLPMVERGRKKIRTRWIVCDALRLPFRDGAFDAAVGVNVLHHLDDLNAALVELRRVASRGVVLHAVLRENLETLWYRHYFPEMDRILLPLHPPLRAAIGMLLRAGFRSVATVPVRYSGRGDLTFESARDRPRLPFDQSFRDATSGFRRLGSDAVRRGLNALAADLEADRFGAIRAVFEREHASVGDCMILRAS